MPETTIAWTHYSMNPWVGCQKVSAECDHCYAEAGSRRLGAQHHLKLWDGDRYFTGEDYWKQPARWDRAAAKAGVRRRVFCASFADVFEDRPDLVDRRGRLLHLITGTPHLDWLLLTKRPEHMVRLAAPVWPGDWPANVWAGTTCGIRASRDRFAALALVPARIRFVSLEPLLEDLGDLPLAAVEWVIVGGESGHHARPFDLAWARRIVAQCRADRRPCFVKQLGSRPFDSSDPMRLVAATMKHPKGEDPNEWDEDLRVREFPS
jgi:protein gp37